MGRSKIMVHNRNFIWFKFTVNYRSFGRSKIRFHNRTFVRYKITANNCDFRQPNWTLVQIYVVHLDNTKKFEEKNIYFTKKILSKITVHNRNLNSPK